MSVPCHYILLKIHCFISSKYRTIPPIRQRYGHIRQVPGSFLGKSTTITTEFFEDSFSSSCRDIFLKQVKNTSLQILVYSRYTSYRVADL
jgi:hypothetical protein